MEFQSESEADNLILLALKHEQAGDISGALRLARRALSTAKTAYLPLDCAKALVAIGRYRFRLGQYETARQLARESLDMTDPTQEPQVVVHIEALLLLGMCALETDSLTECEQYYRSAVDLAREIGHKLLFQRALHNLGSAVYLFHGQFELAIAADSQSLQICHEQGFTDWVVFPLITLAIAYQITGQRNHTREILVELRNTAQPGSAGEGYACYVSGVLALDEDDFQSAEVELSHAYTLAEALGDPSLNLDTRLGIGRMYRLRGDGSKAYAWADDALGFSQRVGYRIYKGRAFMERGRAAWLNGDLVSAETDLLQAETIFIEMGLNCDLAEVRLLLTDFYRRLNDPRSADLLIRASTAIKAGGYGFLLERDSSLVYSLANYFNDPNPKIVEAVDQLLQTIQRVPPKPLRVITLGNLTVWVGAQIIDARSLRQRRAGELLVLLLSTPGYTLSAEQVIEAMCPEKEANAAVDFYHHAISALRRLLEPDLPDRRFSCRYLEVSEERIMLILPPGSKIDFLEFEQSVQDKDWEKSIRLYQGEYLAMLPYHEWTIAMRQHYADLFEQALLALASERLNAGAASDCLSLVRQVLLHNPWQEQAVLLGMRSAMEMNDRMTTIKLYQRLEKTIAKDLGIAPQQELQQFYIEIRKRSKVN